MSWTMTHLIIANEYCKARPELAAMAAGERAMFILGSISPDVVHSRKDFQKEMKAKCHYMQPGKKWGEIYEEKDLVEWYDHVAAFYEERLPLAQTPEEIAFLKGYALHILVDIFNCSLLYGPGFIRYGFQVEEYRADYAREHELWDRALSFEYAHTGELLNTLEQALSMVAHTDLLAKLHMDSVFGMEHLDAGIRWQISRYRTAQPADTLGLTLINESESDFFLKTVLNQGERLLYSFPDPGHAFAIREI